MPRRSAPVFLALAVATLGAFGGCAAPRHSGSACGPLTLHAYVIDSACVFIKDLDQPISRDCAVQCAQAGSPLVLLADDGAIYLPISAAMPAAGQNERLLEFAGQRVVVSGTGYAKAGAHAFVIDRIERETAAPK